MLINVQLCLVSIFTTVFQKISSCINSNAFLFLSFLMHQLQEQFWSKTLDWNIIFQSLLFFYNNCIIIVLHFPLSTRKECLKNSLLLSKILVHLVGHWNRINYLFIQQFVLSLCNRTALAHHAKAGIKFVSFF